MVNLVWYIVPTQPDLHKQTYNVIYSYTHTHAHWIIHNTGSHFKVKATRSPKNTDFSSFYFLFF